MEKVPTVALAHPPEYLKHANSILQKGDAALPLWFGLTAHIGWRFRAAYSMSGTQKTILIVDDEPDIVLILSTILEDAGYGVIAMEKGDHLIQQIRNDNQHPDLILLDMLLSGQHGTEVMRELKQHPATQRIPILILSGHPDAGREARAIGADGFVAKPFDVDDLLSRVALCLAGNA